MTLNFLIAILAFAAGLLALYRTLRPTRTPSRVWICGRILDPNEPGEPIWQFQGAYSSEQLAREACRDDSYFIGPAVVDQIAPVEEVEWDGAYYPLTKCIKCGCDELHACDGGCYWASTSPPICSRCA